ncbi:hypothetical protein HPB50_024165 [Hyalomma asiaticum]|uniref:Uncharacterized protein n=2 Tax=Hyalomma asiaticum TaxID=266040 RepID=A0ACB7SI83_HYAAI|nr:hypothetical protein HPB50_008815 [Hyalomma asiaticum]KAH6934405.1 hypothetical protein HPB50_024165 [Hyalomma asiaticum]
MASRKWKALSLEEKLHVLNAVDKQSAQKRVDIAKDLGLPQSTLHSIIPKQANVQGMPRSSARKLSRLMAPSTGTSTRLFSLGLNQLTLPVLT